MKKSHIKFLICSVCSGELLLFSEVETQNQVETGELVCKSCGQKFPIINFIPRFVPEENYAKNFGFEWLKHSRTQYDSYWGSNLSEKRFFEETKWANNLTGEIILEIGSGAGRFTEHAINTGATVVSMDYSNAVEANYSSNGQYSNLLIVQADLYQMPLRKEAFDKIFCFGVLQHTPNVEKAFHEIPKYLRKGGDLTIDVYPKHGWLKQSLKTKYWVRPLTKKMSHKSLYQFVENYINFMWPISKLIAKLPYGWQINKLLLIMNYQGLHNLREEAMKEWAILDTFDMLSPVYDNPQKISTVRQWFQDENFENFEVIYGYNGIEGRGKKG